LVKSVSQHSAMSASQKDFDSAGAGSASPQSAARLLVKQARQQFNANDFLASLTSLQAAYAINPSESLLNRISRLKEFLEDAKDGSDAEEGNAGSDEEAGGADENCSEVDADDVDFVEPPRLKSTFAKPKPRPRIVDEDDDDEQDDRDNWRRSKHQLPPRRRSPPRSHISKSPLALSNNSEAGHRDIGGGSSKLAEVCPGFSLCRPLFDKLYDHQRAGISWLYSLHKAGKGGILADDMGLGKTIQTIAFLRGLFDQNEIRSVLLIMPVSVIMTWRQEFDKWARNLPVYLYHGQTKRQMEYDLSRVQRRSGVLITTYGMVVSSWQSLACDQNNRTFVWDYVILDEGHKIKNSSRKTSKGVFAIDAKHRLLLTGTAVQNNLMEMWALFDFAHHGTLLGTQKTFKTEYERPIIRSREKDATASERRYGDQMAQSLKARIEPYFLRRTKHQIQASTKQQGQKPSAGPAMPSLTRKNDVVVWLFMSQTQLNIYRDFLQLDQVKALLVNSNRRSPLVELTVLKKICDHPRLLSANQCQDLGLSRAENMLDNSRAAIHLPVSMLTEESGKMAFLAKLMARLKAEGHRTLVFSQSRKMLDIAERILEERGHRLSRLDGRVTQVADRQHIVSTFARDKSIDAFLLTTQVGGVGLTLTAADRVVILDPSWNPAVDAQAVDRAFRIGQSRNVLIYRLITCGTVEEKIYRRQVFKDGITRQTTGIGEADKDPYRYFTKQELRELFKLDDHLKSQTQQQLAELHSGQRRTDPELDEHLAYLHSLNVFGISDHDLMFTQADATEPDVDDNSEASAAAAASMFGGPGLESTTIGAANSAKFAEQRRRQVEETLARENEEMAGRRLDRIDMSRMELSVLQPGSARPANVRDRIEATMHQFVPLSRPKIPQPPRPRPVYASDSASAALVSASASSSAGVEAAGVPSPPPSPPLRQPMPPPPPPRQPMPQQPVPQQPVPPQPVPQQPVPQQQVPQSPPTPPPSVAQLSESIHAMSVSEDSVVSDDPTFDKSNRGDTSMAVQQAASAAADVSFEDSPLAVRLPSAGRRNVRRLAIDSDSDEAADDEQQAGAAAMEASCAASPAPPAPQKLIVPATPERLSDSAHAMSFSEADGEGELVEESGSDAGSDAESDAGENNEPIEVVELSSSDESLQEALQSRPVHSLLSRSLGADASAAAAGDTSAVSGASSIIGNKSRGKVVLVSDSPVQSRLSTPSAAAAAGLTAVETPPPAPLPHSAMQRWFSTPMASGAPAATPATAAADAASTQAGNCMSIDGDD
ncbi:hypothetical protein BOX15_Mlig019690g1, partial [Macrostomum lignano]